MNEFDCLHRHLSGFKRVICIGAEFAPISLAIAIADGVTVPAHWAQTFVGSIKSLLNGMDNCHEFIGY